MKTVLGKLNGTWLMNFLSQSYPRSTSVRAAIAYAEYYEPLIEHCTKHEVALTFYGRVDSTLPVSMRLLDWFLTKAPTSVECRLVNGAYHPKVIWWHGFGAYIGSANLTRNGWERNLECGVFFDEDELFAHGIAEDLDELFDELDRIALPLKKELYQSLRVVEAARRRLQRGLDDVEREYQKAFGTIQPYAGPTRVVRPSERTSKARQEFVSEWDSTLELMRRLCRRFVEIDARPQWVPEGTNPTVHFDQFLHAYYYHQVLKTDDEGASAEKVEAFFERNKAQPEKALEQAARWWASLKEGPSQSIYDEEFFIKERAPRMLELLSAESLKGLTEEQFVEAMSSVNAFRDHARRVDNSVYGLSAGHQEKEEARVERFARWLWAQHTEAGKSVREVLEFVIYGSTPSYAEERLWLAIRDKAWRFPRLGKSTLGEIFGLGTAQ